jgi:peptide/nickel transport system ATP-binding protein
MKAGQIVESGAVEKVLSAPENPYTQALVAAVPEIPA